jgi:uncharacterized membrane protein YdjX (TVP38/TMEM64 family)
MVQDAGVLELFIQASERASELGAAAVVAYLGIYVAGTVALVPGSVLAMVAGALFGFAYGFGIAFAGALLGSTAAFVLARHGARGRVAAWLERRAASHAVYARLANVDRSLGRRSLALVFLLRLSPFVPYNMLNYALGLTRVRVRDFLLGSVGMLPGAFVYAYVGDLAGDVAAAAAGHGAPDGAPLWILLPGLLVTLAAVWVLGRYARSELERLAEPGAVED